MSKNSVILIPAYNPDEKLVELVRNLRDNKILVVDDGSMNKDIFRKINKYCTIIENSTNLGKGGALKKGFKYIMKNYSDALGVVTADADGQHIIEDIEKVKFHMIEEKNKLILGCRDFKEKGVPLRSKFGNSVINFLFKFKTGKKIKDTQTGLRGIPLIYIDEIINISGEKYDYEMNVLKYLSKKGIKIIEVPIKTVYSKNIKSEFRPIKDSIIVFKNFIKNNI